MIYLLDTNVLSERTKGRPSPKVMSFLRQLPAANARVPAIVLGEIKQGVQSNPSPKLHQFLDDVLTLPVAPWEGQTSVVQRVMAGWRAVGSAKPLPLP